MARSRSLSSAPFRQSLRRRTSWQAGSGQAAGTAVTGSGSQILNLGIEFLSDGLTLVRTRGELVMFLTAATAIGDGYNGAFGIGVAQEPAFTAGVGSLPTPITEIDWEGWLFHTMFHVNAAGPIVQSAVAIATDGIAATSAALRMSVDSKAMRKVSTNDTLFAVIEVVETGTAVMNVQWNSRHLIKLP